MVDLDDYVRDNVNCRIVLLNCNLDVSDCLIAGVLLQAMRKGFWIILDELNLAPSDVLEALNRLLDANRELFVPECQEIVKAHTSFMLFGTQNPPGYYGGRKTLSRAFRNRFIEIHFGDIPSNELQEILHKRGALPPAYAKKMIDVMLELQVRDSGYSNYSVPLCVTDRRIS